MDFYIYIYSREDALNAVLSIPNFKYKEIDSIAVGEAKVREGIEKGEVQIVYSNY
jgi:hypothetical protein